MAINQSWINMQFKACSQTFLLSIIFSLALASLLYHKTYCMKEAAERRSWLYVVRMVWVKMIAYNWKSARPIVMVLTEKKITFRSKVWVKTNLWSGKNLNLFNSIWMFFGLFIVSLAKSMMKTFYWFMWCCFLHEYTLVYKHNRLYRAEQHKTWNDFIHLGRSRSRCRITFYLYPWHKLFRLNNIPSSQDILPCLSVW